MNMKNITRILLGISLGLMIFVSCKDTTEVLYNTPDTGAESYLQFTAVNPVFAMTPADTLPFDFVLGIKVLGNAPASDLNVAFEVVNSTVNLDTQVVVGATNLTILANTFSATTTITIDPTKFVLAPDTLHLNLKISAGSVAGAPYGSEADLQFVYNVCPFDITDFLGGFNCYEEGYGDYDVLFSLDADVANRIHNSNYWDWAGPGETVYYDFSGDENQLIDVPFQPFTYGDGTEGSVEGYGNYDACSNQFQTWTDAGYGGSFYPTYHLFTRPEGKMQVRSAVPKQQWIDRIK